jgi:hypothetical protein
LFDSGALPNGPVAGIRWSVHVPEGGETVKIITGRTFALVAALALFASLGAFAGAQPASASGPINQFQYPRVVGVNGTAGSISEMNLSADQRFQVVEEKLPWVTMSSDTVSVASWRYDSSRREYIGISGQYCKNKTGGDVFIATGAPAEAGLTC